MKRYWMMYVYLLFALSACGTQPSASESGATAEDTTAQEENTGSHEETETEQNEEIESNTESEEASQAGNSPESQENNQQLTEDEDKRQQVFQDGTYERISHTSGGLLDIQDSGDHAFSFEINVSEGANVGHLSGNAKMNEDFQATYQGPDSCSLTFEWKDSNILVSSSDDCKYYSGNGVTFDGVFYGEGHAAEIEPDTLSSLGLLTDEQEDLFKAMVGDDYELFLSTFHLIQEEEIIDSFEGEAYSAKVQGLPGMMEGILMHGHGDALWAAIIDEEKVKYYSNNEIMVPETIEEWPKNSLNSATFSCLKNSHLNKGAPFQLQKKNKQQRYQQRKPLKKKSQQNKSLLLPGKENGLLMEALTSADLLLFTMRTTQAFPLTSMCLTPMQAQWKAMR